MRTEQNLKDRINEVQQLYEAGRHSEVIASVTEILKNHPENLPSMLFLGASYVAKQQYRIAIPPLVEFTSKEPNDPTAFYFLALSYWQVNDPARAFQAITKAIQLQPHSFEMHHTLACICLRLGQGKDAELAPLPISVKHFICKAAIMKQLEH
jgi:Tfp pilus assembly protein PilF